MGMFDKPQYLTGTDGFAQEGDTFFLHNARPDGVTSQGGQSREQVKLAVSRFRDEKPTVVWTSGRGIVGQVKRMDAQDREKFPMEVRLDAIPPTVAGNNPTFVLTPANQPHPGGSGNEGMADF